MNAQQVHRAPAISCAHTADATPSASTRYDRWAVARIHRSVAAVPVRFVLWDGFESTSGAGAPVATIIFRNRSSLWRWLWDPDLNFGEGYMSGAVEIRCPLSLDAETMMRFAERR